MGNDVTSTERSCLKSRQNGQKKMNLVKGSNEVEFQKKEILKLNNSAAGYVHENFLYRRILRDYGIRTAFKNYTTLGSILTKVKDKIALERRKWCDLQN